MPVPYVQEGMRLNKAEQRHANAKPVDYTDARSGDLVGSLIGTISSGAYTSSGTFKLTLEVPFDIIGNPTELMRSQGMMVLVELYKVVD